MNRRSLFASILMACLLAVGLAGFAPAHAASAGPSVLKAAPEATSGLIEIGYRHRGYRHRGPRVVFPIGPSYLAHDFPYYASRGYYPRHIGPGYIGPYYITHRYSPYADYSYRPVYYKKSNRRCSHWHRRCAGNWGYRSDDYYGCMEHHRCD